jgi:polyphenol oxidase
METIGWKQIDNNGISYFALQNCSDLQGIRHAFSTRLGGVSPAPFHSLNFGLSTGDRAESVRANQRIFLDSLHATENRLYTLHQVHSTEIHWLSETPETLPLILREGDGLITDRPGNLVGIKTADCCPILLADPQKRVVAAVHAGWKGAIGAIAAKAVRLMHERRGCRPSDIVALIGPTIGACCFQVGTEVRDAFLTAHDFAPSCFREDFDPSGNRINGRWKLDMEVFHRLLLQNCGLQAPHIYALSRCTRCQEDLFYSYRRDGKQTGRMLSVIGLE